MLQRAAGTRHPRASRPTSPALELAGVVSAVGPDVRRFCVGDRVMAVVGGGAQAEMITLHEVSRHGGARGMGLTEAGGFPEAFTVAHDALFSQCQLRPGERLLVNGAAGGVGVAGVQLGVAAGATVVASVRAEELRGAVEDLGAIRSTPPTRAWRRSIRRDLGTGRSAQHRERPHLSRHRWPRERHRGPGRGARPDRPARAR